MGWDFGILICHVPHFDQVLYVQTEVLLDHSADLKPQPGSTALRERDHEGVDLELEWDGEGPVIQTGPATIVFSGEW